MHRRLGWEQVAPVAVPVVLLGCLLLAYGPRLPLLEMGEDAAAALGVRVEPTRVAAAEYDVFDGDVVFIDATVPEQGFIDRASPGWRDYVLGDLRA